MVTMFSLAPERPPVNELSAIFLHLTFISEIDLIPDAKQATAGVKRHGTEPPESI